jgi:phage protein D
MKANYSISIDGSDVSSNFGPVLQSMSITDSDGGKSDTLDIVLNDMYGQLLLPRASAAIQAAIWWEEVPAFSVAGAVTFSGKTDEPKSHGSRSGGLTLSIGAKSADHVGKGKAKLNKQQDNTTFGAVAQQWGQLAGYQVQVDSSLASIKRAYWAMHNESFHNWGRRIAKELGATFKIAYPKAAFVPRNSGTSASGQQLSPLIVVAPGNLISWEITPIQGRGLYANSRAFYYDPAAALYKVVSNATGINGAEADLTDAHKHADQDHATNKSKSNAADSQRKSGGGSIELYGDPRAMSQNDCQLSGARAGVDGAYRIKTARHTFSRGGGWSCSVDVEQPQGAAGSDSRGK